MCFGLQFLLIAIWRTLYVVRNKRRDRKLAEDGVSKEERISRGKIMGEQDSTDFENPYVSLTGGLLDGEW